MCIEYSNKKDKTIQTRIKLLEKNKDIGLSNFENKKIEYKQNHEKMLDTLYAYKSQRTKVRARAHSIDEAEKIPHIF